MKQPGYRKSINRIAESIGTDGEQLLRETRENARKHPYPGKDCYSPDEVVAYERTGVLPDGRAQHMVDCPGCNALMQTLVPNPDLIQNFREEVILSRAKEQDLALSEAGAKSFTPAFAPNRGAYGWSAAAAAVILLIGGSLFIHQRNQQNRSHDQASSAPSREPQKIAHASSVQVVNFTNTPGQVKLKTTVRVDQNGKLDSDSWSRVASTAVVTQGAFKANTDMSESHGVGFVNISLGQSDLQAISNAISSSFIVSDHHDLPVEMSLERRRALVESLRQQLEASRSQSLHSVAWDSIRSDDRNGDVWIEMNNEPVAFINVNQTRNATQQYFNVLEASGGDANALDQKLPSTIKVTMAPSATQSVVPKTSMKP
jgi:hypothetical protein